MDQHSRSTGRHARVSVVTSRREARAAGRESARSHEAGSQRRTLRLLSAATAVVLSAGVGFALTAPLESVPVADGGTSEAANRVKAGGPSSAFAGRDTGQSVSRFSRQAPWKKAPAASSSAAASSAASGTSAAPDPAPSAPASEPAATTTAATQAAAVVPPTTTGAGNLPQRSGLSWRSGVYVPGSKPAQYAAFGDWRGAGLDVVVDWPARKSWDDIVNPSWLYDAWAGTPYTKVFGVAMVPEGDGGATIANCARGAYNDKWRQFGQNIAASGISGETIIRLGWEFNGDWYKWSVDDPNTWAACWRAIVSAAESTAPALRWDWTVNRGAGQSLRDARQAYPGDAYVDIVGIDSYDMWPGVRTEADWAKHYSAEFGLRFWADFARQQGKLVSVPEWGVYPGTAQAGNNGGDNAFYIQKMTEFFRSLGSSLAYEAYFNEPASYYAGALFGPTQNPKASAAYRSVYSAR